MERLQQGLSHLPDASGPQSDDHIARNHQAPQLVEGFLKRRAIMQVLVPVGGNMLCQQFAGYAWDGLFAGGIDISSMSSTSD